MGSASRTVRWKAALLLLPVVAGAVACGTDEGDRAPPEQCRDMVDTLCAKVAECSPSTDRAARGEECEFSFRIQLSCDAVRGTRDMDKCLEAIDAVDCATYHPPEDDLPFPDACRGVLLK